MNRYIADWHYDHENCIAFDNRPFKNVDEMNYELIRRWNEHYTPGDITYVLGDMFWCSQTNALPVLEQLKGQKVLVKGNHDRVGLGAFVKKFDRITDYLEVKDDGRDVVVCHYPMAWFKNHYHGWYHLYGHVHRSFEANMVEHQKYLMEQLYLKPCKMFNVGAMMPYMDYTPRTLNEIIVGCEAEDG